MRILCVDDCQAIWELLSLQLRPAAVAWAPNGETALGMLTDVDVALVDGDLGPGMSGPALVVEMRRTGWQTPVIGLSGDSRMLDQFTARGCPVLGKPWQMSELRAAIEEAVGVRT